MLSSLLFNAGVEIAMRRWKRRLGEQGWLLSPGTERLTNVRYADDTLLPARSLTQIADMISLLAAEFEAIGLSFNWAKCVIISNTDLRVASEAANSLEVAGSSIRILDVTAGHKYLGRKLCADPSLRSSAEISNRVSKAWGAYSKHRHVLTNRDVPLRLRMKLFDAPVTQTVLFALPLLTLAQKHFSHLAVAQRKMLRNIVGWVRVADEPWDQTMARMRDRVGRCWDFMEELANTAAE